MNYVKESSNILKKCDAVLVIAGAGMSADSGIFTSVCFLRPRLFRRQSTA